jgi:niacin transporter
MKVICHRNIKSIQSIIIIIVLMVFTIIIPFSSLYFKVELVPGIKSILGTQVSMFISMMIGPEAALIVGLSSIIGFFIKGLFLEGIRALAYLVVGFAGAILIKKKVDFWTVVAVTAPLHSLLEALFVIPILTVSKAIRQSIGVKISVESSLIAVSTLIQHFIEATIAFVCIKLVIMVVAQLGYLEKNNR